MPDAEGVGRGEWGDPLQVTRWSVLVPMLTLALVTTACTRSGGAGSKTATTTAAGAGTGDFGTLKGVCGPGDAKGATDQGVSDTTIRVGTMADPGNVIVPGLDQELFDSAAAFVGWCNAAGGILGRKLQLDKWDSRLTEVSARMISACGVDFTLVGNGEPLDEPGVEQRVKCKLPEFPAFTTSPKAGVAPMSIGATPNPNSADLTGGGYRALAQADPAAVKHFGLLNMQFASIKQQGEKDRAGAEHMGYTTAYYDEIPAQVDNWRPYAQNIQSKGVQVLTVEAAPTQIAALYKAMQELGYIPKYAILQPDVYDEGFIAETGSALQGHVDVYSYIVPFEQAGSNPATKQYIDMLKQYANGAKPKPFGVNGFSSWLLWAQAAKECGSQLTRTCVVEQASQVKTWDGGGLTAPFQPGNATAPAGQCFVLLKATPKGFVVDSEVTKPNQGVFNCSPDNVPRLPGFPKSG